MANFVISNAARSAMCDALVDLIDGGAGAGTIKWYTASQPAGPDTAIGAQVLLGTNTFSDPAFGGASNGVATASTITDDSSADASNTVAWARWADSNGTAVIDCDVNTSGGDINFNTVSWTAGDAISVTSLTVTQPAS